MDKECRKWKMDTEHTMQDIGYIHTKYGYIYTYKYKQKPHKSILIARGLLEKKYK